MKQFNYDLERMKKALKGPYHTMPKGLSVREFRAWMKLIKMKEKLYREIGYHPNHGKEL